MSETGVDLAHLSVIFDLDGTLIDSVPDIHATANRVMGELGFAPLARAEVQAFVGKGLPNLVARLLERHGQDPAGALHAVTVARFEAEYLTAHSLTTVYPGVLATLSQLATRGAALGVCTNKPLAPARAVMDHLGLTPFFPIILGGDSLALRKPHPDHLHATARALGRSRIVFVGDSEVDAETAHAAGVPFLLFTEGYRKSPLDQIVHTAAFDDWADLPRLVTIWGQGAPPVFHLGINTHLATPRPRAPFPARVRSATPRRMAVTLTSLSDLAGYGFDDIIDARAPAEYAEDHLPGAISLPVLSDAERAEVGTIYKQVNPFTAKKLGAALVSRNVAGHLLGPLADKPGGWRPLVYCWRGGQRSGSFAIILSQIGWRVETLKGGYKAWRSLVVHEVYDTPVRAPMVVLDGNTGSAKTEILKLLPAHGLQVIDLEGLANHRGSLFGAMGPQPSQKAFEGRLAQALAALDPTRPVVVEAESSKIGECRLPPEIWKAMTRAPRVALSAAPAARAQYLTTAYADMVADAARLSRVIDLLKPLHAQEVIAEWHAMAGAGAFADLAQGLMEQHYDPRYAKHRARIDVRLAEVDAGSLRPETLPDTATRVAGAVQALL